MKTTSNVTREVFVGVVVLLLVLTLSGLAAAQVCVQPPEGLVSWWPLDDNGVDIHGGNSGTPIGGFVVAKVGHGFDSGAPGRVVEIADALSLDVTEFTLEAWVRVDDANVRDMGLVWKGSSSGLNITTPYALLVGSKPSVTVQGAIFGTAAPGTVNVLLTDGVRDHLFISNSVLPMGTFTHIAATADGQQVRIYINGQLDVEYGQSVTPFNSSEPFLIGNFSGPNFFAGVIDELALYNRSLSAAEIQAIYDAGSAGKCKASDQCTLQFAQCQVDLAGADQEIQVLEAQVNALTAQNTQLQQELQNSQSQLADLTTVLRNGLISLTSDFRSVFNDPTFVIPGATLAEQYQNLITAILNLNKGRKEGLYTNLEGKPGRGPR